MNLDNVFLKLDKVLALENRRFTNKKSTIFDTKTTISY